ncbi:MAG: RDD family protein [Planctomycetota bacterium]
MSENPYLSPSTMDAASFSDVADSRELASRSTRFVSAMLDGVLVSLILFPIQFGTGFYARAQIQQVGIREQFAMAILGALVMLLLHGYLLYSRGQTIGKWLTGLQIVDEKSHQLLGFLRLYVLRYLWTLPLVVLIILIPGTVDDIMVNIVVLMDVLLIFGVSRRCLHDYIAGTTVVLYRDGRQKASA